MWTQLETPGRPLCQWRSVGIPAVKSLLYASINHYVFKLWKVEIRFCPCRLRDDYLIILTMLHKTQPASVDGPERKQPTFSKIFRWQPETPGGPMPVRVEVTGTFNAWQRVALKWDRVSGVWQVTVENIPGNRTHNYMILVNGRPVADKNADGMAIPHTAEEKAHAFTTARGPRVFMLASNTK